MSDPTTNASTDRPLSRLVAYARGHRRAIRLAGLCSVLNKLFDLAPPVLIGMAVDVVVEREASVLAQLGWVTPGEQLTVLAIATVLIWGLESAFEYAYGVLWRNLAQTLQHALRLDVYGHTQRLEMGFFEDQSTGGLMSILNDDINQLERFLDSGANDLIQVATTVVVVGGAFFFISPSVALLSFMPIPVVLWGSFRFQRKIAPRYAEVRARVGSLNSLLSNNLTGIATIKSFTAEDREIEQVRRASLAYQESNREAIRLSAAFSPLIRMAIVIGFTATLVYGGMLTFEGTLAVGAYSVLIFMTQRLLWPLTRLGSMFDLYQRAMASTTRVLDLLDTPIQIEDGVKHLASIEGTVRFDDARFSYVENIPVLQGLSIEIPAGTSAAIVGATGAGKTSVVKLLLRFYELDSGQITIDGQDIRGLKKDALRRLIGLVSQDVFLFHGTVRENIAYGRPDAPDSEIQRAAEAAEAHEFITALPQGYDTVVGERGQKLSGGQRQRLSIARAILKDPPILVLDEATSAVDNETEAAVQRSLTRVAVGRTMLVIAHRLSTIRNADCIHVLKDGRVIEQGTHPELIAVGGLYAELWRVQTGARADEART